MKLRIYSWQQRRCESVMKVSLMASSRKLEDLSYEEIPSNHEKQHETEKKFFFDEKTKSMSMH